MDFSSSPGCNSRQPCHHHHHFHHHPHCPLHSFQYTPNIHSQLNPSLAFPPIFPQDSNLQLSNCHQDANVDAQLIPEGDEKGLEEEEEDYVYVLTDEWKEFFAKSEAKRRLAKKHAKKKKVN